MRRTAGLVLLTWLAGTELISAQPLETPGSVGAVYVGNKACKKCHFLQYRSWKATGMAGAFELLAPGARAEGKTRVGLDPNADYRRDAGCLGCHSTGFGEPGGFRTLEETPELAGVGCESCHGPGGGDGYLKVMTLSNKHHQLEEMTSKGLVFPVTAQRCTELCHNQRSPHNESVDPRYAFRWDERIRKGADHGHWKLIYDHGPLPESTFQTLHPELRVDFEGASAAPQAP